MKKVTLLSFSAALALTSCSVVNKTASQGNVDAVAASAVISDLDVSDQKITYTLVPSKKVRRGGLGNCINTAISEALEKNGGGDVLLETQKAIIKRQGILGLKIKSVTVTGYPATYKNFRPVDAETMKQAIVNGTLSNRMVRTEKKGLFSKIAF